MFAIFFKRLWDIALSALLLDLFSLVLIIITLLLLVVNRGKPFFFQHKSGFKEKKVRINKFMSINDKKNNEGILLPDNERITPLGRLIRLSSKD